MRESTGVGTLIIAKRLQQEIAGRGDNAYFSVVAYRILV